MVVARECAFFVVPTRTKKVSCLDDLASWASGSGGRSTGVPSLPYTRTKLVSCLNELASRVSGSGGRRVVCQSSPLQTRSYNDKSRQRKPHRLGPYRRSLAWSGIFPGSCCSCLFLCLDAGIGWRRRGALQSTLLRRRKPPCHVKAPAKSGGSPSKGY